MPELYFPFYGSDWLGDTQTRRMSIEQRGLFIDLLCHAWDGGSIPADQKALAALVGITPRKLASLWPGLDTHWQSDGNGGLVNPKLEDVRQKQQAKRRAGSAGGKG